MSARCPLGVSLQASAPRRACLPGEKHHLLPVTRWSEGLGEGRGAPGDPPYLIEVHASGPTAPSSLEEEHAPGDPLPVTLKRKKKNKIELPVIPSVFVGARFRHGYPMRAWKKVLPVTSPCL
jgi:hypothetical protein